MVVCGEDEALHCAVRFYFRQRSFGKVYLFPVSICRKGFILVTSERERMKLGLPVKSAVSVLGDRPDDAEEWRRAKNYERLKTAYKEAIRSLRHEKDV